MSTLRSIILTILLNSAAQAASFGPPPADTGIELRIKECKPHPNRTNFNLISVEVTNTAKVDYWVCRRKEAETDLLFSENNPKNYSYLLADDHHQSFRKTGRWEPFDGYHMEIGGLLEKLEPGKKIVFRIPVDTTIFVDPKAVIILLFFARDPEDPSSAFHLIVNPKVEKAQQDGGGQPATRP